MEDDRLVELYRDAETDISTFEFINDSTLGQYYELVARFNTAERVEDKRRFAKLLVQFCRVRLKDKFRTEWWQYKLRKVEQ